MTSNMLQKLNLCLLLAAVSLVACTGAPGGEAPRGAGDASAAEGRSLIGRWRDMRPMVESTIEIARVDGALVLEQTFVLDGSTLRHDLVESGAEQGRRFDAAGEEAGGAYWVVTPGGQLQIYDQLGLVATAQPD